MNRRQSEERGRQGAAAGRPIAAAIVLAALLGVTVPGGVMAAQEATGAAAGTGRPAAIAPYRPPVNVPPTGLGYRGDGSGVYPNSTPPVSWDETTGKNIKWKVAMPNFSTSAPVPMGNRVLSWSEWGWKTAFPVLHCFDAETGAEVWSTVIDPIAALSGLSAEECETLRKDMDLCHAQTHAAFRLTHTFLRAGGAEKAKASPEFLQSMAKGLREAGYEVPDPDALLLGSRALATLKLRPEVEKRHKEAIARLQKHGLRHRVRTCDCGISAFLGVATPTPVSDGEKAYVMTALATVACLDMNDGKVLWQQAVTDLAMEATDWLYCSPRLYGNQLLTCFGGLLCKGNRLIAWDKSNGQKLWDMPLALNKKWGSGEYGGNMAILHLPDSRDQAAPLTPVVVTPYGDLVRISDGKPYALSFSPVSIYSGWGMDRDKPGFLCTDSGRSGDSSWTAWLLTLDGEQVLQKTLWTRKGLRYTGHPVCWQERIYCSKFQYDAQGRFHGGDHDVPKTLLDRPTASEDPAHDHGGDHDVPKTLLADKTLLQGYNAPVCNGTLLVGAKHVYGLAARHGFGMSDWGWGDAVCEVFTLDGKRVARNTLSSPPLDEERLLRITSQIPKFSGSTPNFSVTCPMALAGERLYFRSNDHLYCIGPTEK